MDCSIIIPAFNDQDGLNVLVPQLLDVLKNSQIQYEILIVDDGSNPPLRRPAGETEVKVIRSLRNRGYGAAIKQGIFHALGRYILLLDADNQHDPAYIPEFLSRIQNRDMVVGMRTNNEAVPFWRRPGKLFLRFMMNSMSDQKVRDINCGFRCMRKEVIQKYLHLCSDGFSFSISSTMLLLSRRYEVEFLEITSRKRIGVSHVNLHTGFQAIILIIRMVVLTNPLRFFLPVSIFFFLCGLLWGIPYALEGHGVSVGALFLMITGILSFFFGILSEQISDLLKTRYE